MASEGRPLPKFGEWDVNNPASAEGFTVIFSNARDEKKGGAAGTAGNGQARGNKNNSTKSGHSNDSQVKKRFCCF